MLVYGMQGEVDNFSWFTKVTSSLELFNFCKQIFRFFNDVPDEKLNFSPEDLPHVQGKMMNVQKLGSKINQLQQKDDFDGAMGLYGEFNAAIQQLMAPPHQFYVIARRSYSSCLWVKYGNKIRRDN